MYSPRTIEASIESTASCFPVLLATGARGVGKTTLLRALSGKTRRYVSLDDPRALALAREFPAMFFERYPPPVLVDEIQYAPELLPYIKTRVDADQTPGRFWLIGTPQVHLLETLAGRVGGLELLGLSRCEALGQGRGLPPFLPDTEQFKKRAAADEPTPTSRELYEIIWRGSFPTLALDTGLEPEEFYRSYVAAYLRRDVRDLAAVGDEAVFLCFMRAAAARTGQLLNVAALARDAGVAPNTAKKWVAILQASGLVYLLEPFPAEAAKRMVKAPKLHFLDTGLVAYLTECSGPEELEAGTMAEAILETWAFGEILKGWLHNGLTPSFCHYRDKDGKEIDLLIIRDGVAYPVEIKKTASPHAGMVGHFSLAGKAGLRVGVGTVLCLARKAVLLPLTSWGIPAGWV